MFLVGYGNKSPRSPTPFAFRSVHVKSLQGEVMRRNFKTIGLGWKK
jgi:hypothetical protein